MVVRGLVGLIRLATVLVGGGIVVAFTLAALGPRIAEIYNANESTPAEINLDTLSLRSIVYDSNGDEFDVLYDVENRELVELDDVSDAMIGAVIAVEDEGFREHNGIDMKAILRALIRNVSAGGIEEGGSTITQQLIKNGVVGDAIDIDRKIPEAALARRLEQQLTKDEILEAYLNTVYFGGGAYGVRAAAEIYFGTSPDLLTYPQAALLAGLIANPSRYDPTLHPVAAEARRNVALGRLVDAEYVTEDQEIEFRAIPVPTSRVVPSEWQPTNYFIEEVRRQLLDDPRLGQTSEERAEQLFGGGLRVYTTYDPRAQAAARIAVDRFTPDDKRGFVGALASVEPGTGKVRAVIGGPGFEVEGYGEFNIAVQGGRPTGSSFKSFVLAAAMEKGLVPADQVDGSATCVFDNPGGSPNPYSANNFNGANTGSVRSIRSQTLSSSNCAYLRLGQIVGLSNVADTARALGVTNDDLYELPISMPLGPLNVTPLDMAVSYATFANDGLQVDPIFIERVEDRSGNVIFSNEPAPQRAISTQSARLVTGILEGNVEVGTGTRARLTGQPAAGKTGTGQEFKNAWFVGYTPYLSTAVWMGNPLAEVEMRRVVVPELGGARSVTGGSAPAAIWQAYMEFMHTDLARAEFSNPAPTRSGERVRTDQEEDRYNELADSLCGDEDSEVDEDEDGEVDFCEDSGFRYDPSIGLCPSLLEPVDLDEDGKIEACVPPTTTTTTTTTEPPTTTTTEPPTTTTTEG